MTTATVPGTTAAAQQRKLTQKQRDAMEEISYDFIYKAARDSSGRKHGYIKRAPEGGAWEKASITVKALLAFPSPLLAAIPSEEGRIYLTSMGWATFIDAGNYYPPVGSNASRLTALADRQVEFLLSMMAREDGDDAGVAGEQSRRSVSVQNRAAHVAVYEAPATADANFRPQAHTLSAAIRDVQQRERIDVAQYLEADALQKREAEAVQHPRRIDPGDLVFIAPGYGRTPFYGRVESVDRMTHSLYVYHASGGFPCGEWSMDDAQLVGCSGVAIQPEKAVQTSLPSL